MAPLFTGLKLGFGRLDSEVSQPKNIIIYLWGAVGAIGRGPAVPQGGFTEINASVTPGTTIGYIVGHREGSRNFFLGGPGNGVTGQHGGGFSASFLGPSPEPSSRSVTIGVAGGAGGGGNDGFTISNGGYGGGDSGGAGQESPDQGPISGNGGTQVAGGSAQPAPAPGSPGTAWLGGNGNQTDPGRESGGGGGGWYGGGGGGAKTSYDAGGGGGSGYIISPGVLSNPFGTINVTSAQTINGSIGAPAPIAAVYPYAGGNSRVVIIVNGVAVVNSTTVSGPTMYTYTIT
jgi:hypothetical protein